MLQASHVLTSSFLMLTITIRTSNSFTPSAHIHSKQHYTDHFSSHTIRMETHLFMAKNSNRARTEKNLEEMMGDDWRLFRARLVAQENDESKDPLSEIRESELNTGKQESSNFYEDDEQITRQSQIANLFSGAIASIFSNKEEGTVQHHKLKTKDKQEQSPDETTTLDGPEFINQGQGISIGSTKVPSFICEDPFASEEEIVATTQYISAARQLDKYKWAHPISHIEPGCVLIANEKLGGVFHQTVVLIIDHHESTGSTGVVINRPLPGNLLKVASETVSNVDLSLKLAFNCATVTYGGPVMQEDYSILHGYGEVEGSKKVAPGIFVGGSRELMDEVRSNNFDPHEALFIKGHAAWVPSQLSREINKGVWYTASVSPEFVLRYANASNKDKENQTDDLWYDILTCMGGKFSEIANRFAELGDRRVGP